MSRKCFDPIKYPVTNGLKMLHFWLWPPWSQLEDYNNISCTIYHALYLAHHNMSHWLYFTLVLMRLAQFCPLDYTLDGFFFTTSFAEKLWLLSDVSWLLPLCKCSVEIGLAIGD